MKKLGLGIQSFSKFKNDNLIYVDKTKTIHKLITEGTYWFLSRPRRFGKSLLMDTISEIFSGNQALFQECWIYDNWDWDEKHTVINISFSKIDYRKLGLEEALKMYLNKIGKINNIEFDSKTFSGKFLELIEKLGREKPVVVLIDEYDKPIIDYLGISQEKTEHEKKAVYKTALKNRDILKTFYTGLKDQDKYIRLFFVTGVSKFSRVSIFSDLNHLTDITIHDDYSTVVGYSQEEITQNYGDYLELIEKKLNISRPALMEKIKEWYNGYSWDGINYLYNPYSLLNLFNLKRFKNFWFETGSPTFIINKLKEHGGKINESVNTLVNEEEFNKYDIDNINITAIMFQTGYLTIKKCDWENGQYLLDYPNKEVRDSFLNFAVKHYAGSSPKDVGDVVDLLVKAIHKNDMERFTTIMKSLFSSITSKQLEKVKKYEGFYHSIIYIVLKILGFKIDCEIQSHFGSTDAVIKTDKYIYVLEFKMGTAQQALEQIKEKEYWSPYLADQREIVLVGFSFDKTKRNLDDYLSETLKK